jgi:hypothetical protein
VLAGPVTISASAEAHHLLPLAGLGLEWLLAYPSGRVAGR